ncbi:MAG TPA: hypothetical protein PKW18_09230 [Candidatus Sumerlaeota bacterium]|nr:hypothetical protein [Candidatus Sumerlaeota bacterium]
MNPFPPFQAFFTATTHIFPIPYTIALFMRIKIVYINNTGIVPALANLSRSSELTDKKPLTIGGLCPKKIILVK